MNQTNGGMLDVELPDEIWPCERCRDYAIGFNRLWCSDCGYNICKPCQSERAHSCLSDNR